MQMPFPVSYACEFDPELPGSGKPGRLCSMRTRSAQNCLVRIAPNEGDCWYAVLGGSELVAQGRTEICPTPSPVHLVVLVNGRGYYIDTRTFGAIVPMDMEPISQTKSIPRIGLLVLCSPWQIVAYGRDGELWRTARIAVDGISLGEETDGWLHADIDDGDEVLPVTVDLDTGRLVGGGCRAKDTRR